MRRNAPRLAVILAAVALGVVTPAFAQAPDPTKLAEAKKHMEAGAAFYNDPSGHKCEEAVREFKLAYELSGSLNALKGAAVCSLELERDGEAIEQYETFLQGKGASLDPGDKAQIESDLKALKAGVAYVIIKTDRPNVRIGNTRTPSRGFPIQNRYTMTAQERKLGIHPGQHVFTASAEGEPDLTWKIDIVNGSTHEHVFSFDAAKAAAPPGGVVPVGPGPQPGPTQPDQPTPAEGERPVWMPVWIFGGLTVAGLIGTGVTMGLASGKKSDYDALNEKGTATEDDKAGVESANLIPDILLGVTGAFAVTTIVLYVVRPTVKPSATGSVLDTKSASRKAEPTIGFTPAVGSKSGGGVVYGTF